MTSIIRSVDDMLSMLVGLRACHVLTADVELPAGA